MHRNEKNNDEKCEEKHTLEKVGQGSIGDRFTHVRHNSFNDIAFNNIYRKKCVKKA